MADTGLAGALRLPEPDSPDPCGSPTCWATCGPWACPRWPTRWRSVPRVSFLAAPVLHLGQRVGSVFLAEKEDGQEFTPEDEETLALFAAQAALAIANARRHREERRARAGLETLIETSPVGVAVLDAGTGLPSVLQPGGPAHRGPPAGPRPGAGEPAEPR